MSDQKSAAVASAAAAPSGKSKEPASDAKRAELVRQLIAEIARLDRLLVGAVLLLAFLLASFVVRNTDFWLHLATGRAIAEGKYTFGVDPFSYTTTDTYWVNHSWLYDLLLYELTMLARGPDSIGGILVVVLKALAFTALAALLMAIRRPQQGRYVPACCVGLALVAMTPRMMLQPIAVSFLFLGLTLYLLAREGKPDGSNVRGWRLLTSAAPQRLYALPVLFLLWVNLDQWFLLGPLTVALYLLGDKMQQALMPDYTGPDVPRTGEQTALVRVLALGLVACLLNPHHVRAFALPVELLPTLRLHGFRDDPRFAALFVSPFEGRYFTAPFALHVAGMAYFPLLLAGLVSFWLTRDQWRAWRVLVWTAFAGLSAANMLLIPFFAVAAAPITALNFQDYVAARAARRAEPGVRFLRVMLSARLLTMTLAVILLFGAWPGWLGPHAANAFLARRVGWGVEVDPSLKAATYKLDYWRQQGWLRPGDHGFNMLPEIANYCAWFCPEEKGFLDGRYGLFAGVAAAYGDVRYVLGGGLDSPTAPRRGPGGVPDWQGVLRDQGINHVILHGPNWERTATIVNRLLADPAQWVPLYLDGRTSIFGWRDPQRKDASRFTPMRLDDGAAAFGSAATTAPSEGPGPLPPPRSWLDRYLSAPTPLPLDADRAAESLVYFESIRRQWQGDHERDYAFLSTVRVLGSGNPVAGGMISAAAVVGTAMLGGPLRGQYLASFDVGPPGTLVVGVRAARRAVAENPHDLDAFLALARTTDALAGSSQESHWARVPRQTSLTPAELMQMLREKQNPDARLSPWLTRALSVRQVLRRVQVLTALHQILALQPDSPTVHHYLFTIYWNMNYYDAALDHLREEVRLFQGASGRLLAQQENNLKQLEKLLADCEKQVNELQRGFEFAVAGRSSRVQAMWAFRPFGLARQSLAALLREDIARLNSEEAGQVIWLYLTLGKAEELRGQLTESQKAVLGPGQYATFRAILAAALGDYAEADHYLAEAVAAMPPPDRPPLPEMLQALTFGQLQPPGMQHRLLAPFLQEQVIGAHRTFVVRQQFDDLIVLRGLLALEVGDLAAAVQHFQQALRDPTPRYDFETKPIAVRYLELMKPARQS